MSFYLQFLGTHEMVELKEQRFCIKFCLKLRKNTAEAFEIFEVYFGEPTMGRTHVYEWFSKLKCGVTSREEAERS
jgi:hypothetical protein